MKLWVIGALAAMTTAPAAAQVGTVPDPTAAERRRSVETGLCVVREDWNLAARMLRAGANTGVQNRFMVLIRKCASPGKMLFPNVVMGAAAESIMTERGFSIDALGTAKPMPKAFLDNPTNRLFACAITAAPAALKTMLRTRVGAPEEPEAIQDFRLALEKCDAVRGRAITAINIRASAARAAFVMVDHAR
ncbi:hypothetical protein U1701_03690 [Sphingomonas sp. PB2P19]|uniref:hypothetical protein n=1 Tax=Sphingomonas rhamnosi TaxID=3096156 RepID=UPI002FC9C31B